MAVSLALVGVPSLLQWLPGIGWFFGIVLLLTDLLAMAAFIRIAASHCVDLRFSAFESIRRAWSRFGKMVVMSLVLGLGVATVAMMMITIGSAILAGVAPGMSEELSLDADDPFATPLGTLLPFMIWTFVMVLPAIALAIMWWVAPMAVMVEGTGAISSLGRSWRLVLPHLWRTTKVFFLSAAVIVPPVVFLYWLLPYYLAVLVGGLLTLPFSSVIGTVLYLDLRARSEDLSSDILIEELTSTS